MAGEKREPVAGGLVQERAGVGEHMQALMECGVPYATDRAQLTQGYWAAGCFERGGDAFVDGDLPVRVKVVFARFMPRSASACFVC